jgi:hypothetical protein
MWISQQFLESPADDRLVLFPVGQIRAYRERICLDIEQFDVLFDLVFFYGLFIDVPKVSFSISNIPGTIGTKRGGFATNVIT